MRTRAPIPPVLLLLFFALLKIASPAWADPLFPNPVYPTGSNPYGLGLADFNRDGIQDMVVSNFGAGYDGQSGDLSLRFGRGDGTFGDETRILTTEHPSNVLAADIDGDGVGDLILNYYPSSQIVSRRGLGDGTFGPDVPIAGSVYSIQLADINHDGIPDLLSEAALSTGGFQVFLGLGDGTFSPGPVTGPTVTNSPIAGDFNGDGLGDVAAMHYVPGAVGEVLIFLGAGDGTFQAAPSLFVNDNILRLSTADVDGDGRDDLAVETLTPHDDGLNSDVSLFFSNGDGTFLFGRRDTEVYLLQLIATDLNHDGHQDYVRIGWWDVASMLGNGDRTYAEQPFFYAGTDNVRSLPGDFDRDGRLDLAIVSNSSEAVFLYAGNDQGGFGPPVDTTVRDSYLGGLVTDDFNGDGLLDMAASVLEQDQVAIKIGHGDGTFGPETRFPAGVGPLTLASADMNVDGLKDLVVLVRNWHFQAPNPPPTGNVGVLLGNGDGTFQPPALFDDPGLRPVEAMHVRDLDGDGVPDVVVANGTDSEGSFQPDLSYFHGNGDGTLTPAGHLSAGTVNVYPYAWTYVQSLASGDFDGDGVLDIVVALSGLASQPPVAGTVRILRGLGGGAFADPVTVGETVSSASVAVADLNGDGEEDIVVADAASYTREEPGALFTLLNDGAGNFTPSGPLLAGIGPFDVHVFDMTGDGISDLVSFNNAGYLAILPGLGGGTFGTALNFGLFGAPLALVIGDFDGDGRSDLLVVSASGVFVLHAQSGAPPPPPPLQIEAHVSFRTQLGHGTGTLTWTTNAESDLQGFNVMEIGRRSSRILNSSILACKECDTGLGATYTFGVDKHRSGRNFYIQAVHIDGTVEIFGPALIEAHSIPSPEPTGTPSRRLIVR